jgi:hypothetical protein
MWAIVISQLSFKVSFSSSPAPIPTLITIARNTGTARNTVNHIVVPPNMSMANAKLTKAGKIIKGKITLLNFFIFLKSRNSKMKYMAIAGKTMKK